jgi:hypothetical protein
MKLQQVLIQGYRENLDFDVGIVASISNLVVVLVLISIFFTFATLSFHLAYWNKCSLGPFGRLPMCTIKG